MAAPTRSFKYGPPLFSYSNPAHSNEVEELSIALDLLPNTRYTKLVVHSAMKFPKNWDVAYDNAKGLLDRADLVTIQNRIGDTLHTQILHWPVKDSYTNYKLMWNTAFDAVVETRRTLSKLLESKVSGLDKGRWELAWFAVLTLAGRPESVQVLNMPAPAVKLLAASGNEDGMMLYAARLALAIQRDEPDWREL